MRCDPFFVFVAVSDMATAATPSVIVKWPPHFDVGVAKVASNKEAVATEGVPVFLSPLRAVP